MNIEKISIFGNLLILAAGALLSWLSWRRQARRDDSADRAKETSDLIDNLQAQVSSLAAQIREQNTKIASQDRKIDELRDERKTLEDYVYLLRQHITLQKPPPPPPWPKSLAR